MFPKHKIDSNKPKVKLPSGKSYLSVKKVVEEGKLHTICQSGNCPNLSECWGAGTATFMILGNICTRSCRFCSVETGKPLALDLDEPKRIADSVKQMKLKHCVITSVDRDDLTDGGALHWAKTVNAVKTETPLTTIEILIPDFKFDKNSLNIVIASKPNIISHNLETVERLTKQIRVQAKYRRSLDVLKYLHENGVITKSGIMLGLGETLDEVYSTMDDLLEAGCNIVTIGQYLQPTTDNVKVEKYYSEEEFNNLKIIAIQKGFKVAECGSLVRSSYHAEKHLI
ncbi:MAG: lipoyl synthase [Bacteroidia bacterium]|nr:lipoyl synthase [Bacteroidia bacterium]